MLCFDHENIERKNNVKRNQKIKQFSSFFPLLSLSLDSWKETVFFTPSKVIFLEVKSAEKFNSSAFFGDFYQ